MSNLATTNGNMPVTLNIFDPVQFESLQRLAMMLCKSDLVPKMYQETNTNPKEKAVSNIIIALSLASRMGADQLMVMQNLVIIQGRPTWSAKFLIATVNTSGRYEPLEYEKGNKGKCGKVKYTDYIYQNGQKVAQEKEFDGTNIDNITVYAYTTDKNSGKVLKGAEISIVMAIKEGWYQKAGSKWPTMPEQMLIYRAASFWVNAYAPDISMGMRTTEEANDITIDTDYEDLTPTARANAAINANANTKTLQVDPDPAVDPAPDNNTQPDNSQPDNQQQDPQQQPDNNQPANTPPAAGNQSPDSNPGGLFTATDKAKGPGFN